MKIFSIFFLLIGVYCSSVLSKEFCYNIKKNYYGDEFKYCRLKDTLISVEAKNKLSASSELTINHDKLTTIQPNAFKNVNITNLIINFADKELKFVPQSFNGLPNLKGLYFHRGYVQLKDGLFENIKNITNLKLKLNGNSKDLRKPMSELKNLRSLDIHQSNLKIINGNTFPVYSPIVELWLTRNNISTIEPFTFALLKNIKFLNLRLNNLNNLQQGVFYGLDNLNDLLLSNNKLTYVPKKIFHTLKKLETLNLDNNDINDIEMRAFWGVHAYSLDLSYNKLTVIRAGYFQGMTLKNLYLMNNAIVAIENSAFRFSNFDSIHLYNNSMSMVVERGAWELKDNTTVYLKAFQAPGIN